MSVPMICSDTRNAISLPGLQSGVTPCGKPDGPMTDLFGQAHAHVSPSAQPEKAKATRTSATYGRTGIGSSASAILQSALVSKLMPRLEQAGSTMFAYRLNRLVTPSGRSVSRLAASGRRTSGSDFTSWRSPSSQESGIALDRLVNKDGTPWSGGERAYDKETERLCEVGLPQEVQLSSWATPRSEDSESTGAHRGTPDTLTSQSWLAGWVSPTACSPNSLRGNGQDPKTRKAGGHAVNLQDQVRLTGWATPTGLAPATEQYNAAGNSDGLRKMLDQAQLTASGLTPNGSPAGTGKAGQLNPALPRWLQGLPPEWCEAAIAAHRLIQATRRKRA